MGLEDVGNITLVWAKSSSITDRFVENGRRRRGTCCLSKADGKDERVSEKLSKDGGTDAPVETGVGGGFLGWIYANGKYDGGMIGWYGNRT